MGMLVRQDVGLMCQQLLLSDWHLSQLVECLPSLYEVLGLAPCTTGPTLRRWRQEAEEFGVSLSPKRKRLLGTTVHSTFSRYQY